MSKYQDIFIFVFVAVLAFCLGLLICNGCQRHRVTGHDTITVTVSSVDTVYAEADTVWLDSIVYNAGSNSSQSEIVRFIKDDSIIYISGFCSFHPPLCSLSYYVKPHQITLSWLDDSLLVTTAPDHYQVVEIVNNRGGSNNSGGFLYVGGGYNLSNRKIIPEIGLGYKFGKWGIKGGITGEYITAGILYHF